MDRVGAGEVVGAGECPVGRGNAVGVGEGAGVGVRVGLETFWVIRTIEVAKTIASTMEIGAIKGCRFRTCIQLSLYCFRTLRIQARYSPQPSTIGNAKISGTL